MRRLLLRLGLAFASFGLVFVLAELVLRLLGYGAIYDVYSKPSILWRKDPLLGWSHQPSSTAHFVGPRPWPIEFENDVAINSIGLRGPEIEPRPAEGVRILFMGDSQVASFEVEYEETFVHRVGQRLGNELGAPVQTINGGVRGYGTDQSLLWFRDRGHRLEPDIVVFLHATNDAHNNMTLHRLRRPFGKPAFSIREDGGLELVGMPVPDYPMCESYGLDDQFRPGRRDRWFQRLICHLEVQLADRSALFTFATLQIQRSPELLHFLHGLGMEEGPPQASRRDALDTLLAAWPFGAGVAHADSELPSDADGKDGQSGITPGFRLTSLLLAELAREVRGRGADFVVIMGAEQHGRLDLEPLREAGGRVLLPVFPDAFSAGVPMTFQNDAHYNHFGHNLIARILQRDLSPYVRERLERAGGPADDGPDGAPDGDSQGDSAALRDAGAASDRPRAIARRALRG